MYARGILFGKMKYELGDHSFVKCPENGLTADLEFKARNSYQHVPVWLLPRILYLPRRMFFLG
jgi:hypothetical protein